MSNSTNIQVDKLDEKKQALLKLLIDEVQDRDLKPLGQTPKETSDTNARPAKPSVYADRIAKVVAEVLQIGSVDLTENLLNLGANSLDIIRLANKLEREFGFRPDMESFLEFPSVEALARYYDQHQAEQDRIDHTTESVHTSPLDKPASEAGSDDLILDLDERAQFPDARHGIRRDLEEGPSIQLDGSEMDTTALSSFRRNRSHRKYMLNPISFQSFSHFLSHLREVTIPPYNYHKYQYPSAGELYPVQTYIHVKAGRIEDVAPGIFYYHPQQHQLQVVTPNLEIDRDVHVWTNRPNYDQAAFSVFFVAQMNAIKPMYGNLSRDFCMYEAGAMGQLLRMVGPDYNIGLVSIGDLRFEPIRDYFRLSEGHTLIHVLIGGQFEPETAEILEPRIPPRLTLEDRARLTLERVEKLSTEETSFMLKEKKRSVNPLVDH